MRPSLRPLLALVVLAAVLIVGGFAAAQSCAHRGDLDALSCDEDRDLIADPPKDKSKLISPDP
jgi:phosphonate transport system substrate-binding protein